MKIFLRFDLDQGPRRERIGTAKVSKTQQWRLHLPAIFREDGGVTVPCQQLANRRTFETVARVSKSSLER